MYSDVQLFIDGAWRPAVSGKTLSVLNPATGEAIGTVAHAEKADLDRGARRGAEGLCCLAQGVGLRPLQDDAQGRRHPARQRDRDRHQDDDGAGQAAGRGQGRDARRRRRDRLVRRGGAPRLWPRDPGARRGRLPARDQGAGRPGRRVHAVEFPDQPGGAQDLGGARGRLLDHHQGAGGDAGRLRRADRRLRECRRAGRRRSTWCSACRRKSRNT